MKAIRIELSQQTANYKVETSYALKHSYPLPTYSAVIGMVHAACGFTDYHPMKVSIQGKSASSHVDINTAYFFGGGEYEEPEPGKRTRHQFKVKRYKKPGYIGITKGLSNIQILNDVELILHIVPEDKEDYETILTGLIDPKVFLSLGRHEDLVRIDSVKEVELQLLEDDPEFGFYGYAYIPLKNVDEIIRGTVYKINKEFSYNKKGHRVWNTIVDVVYSNQETGLNNIYEDPENRDLAVFA